VHRRKSHHALAVFAAVVVVVAAAAAVYEERHQIRKLFEGKTAAPTVPTTTARKAVKPVSPPAAVAVSVEPWQLPVPITEALVLPGPPGKLLVAGGLIASGSSGNGAFLVSTSDGKLSLYANLLAGLHDTAGTDLAGNEYVFGGLAGGPSATVESFAAPGTGTAAGTVNATATGTLPAARAGGSAVTIGATAYIVGGYDGPSADGQVLATSDGTSFAVVAKLPVPVRDAAVTAVGGQIYVFGGSAPPSELAAPAGGHWGPVADIQHVNPVTGKATVVGHLPTPLEGAVAVNLAGRVYVAGGHGPLGWSGTVYGFEPATGRVVVAGHLPHPVSGAGATVEGGVAWLVGGDSPSGAPVGWVQAFRLAATHLSRAAPPATARKPVTSS
jgi:hypothetical protein